MSSYLILLDFDGTVCSNKLFHKKAYEQTLTKFDVYSELPSSWFGMTTENVFKELLPNRTQAELSQLVAEKRKIYEKIEYRAPINKNILEFLISSTPILDVKIFSNGKSKRINKYLSQYALTLDIISFADLGLRKENGDDFLRVLPKGFNPSKVLLIDDNSYIAPIAEGLGINFLHYKPSLDIRGEVDDFLDSSSG